MKKRIYIFVGPKGAGKSFLASEVAARFDLHFLRVEDIWMSVKARNLPNEEFEREGSSRVLEAVQALLRAHDQLIIESIGASRVFSEQLTALREIADVLLVRIRAPLTLCLDRVKARDPSTHLDLSDERVAEINEIAAAFEMKWDMEYENASNGGSEAFASLFAATFLKA